MSNGEKILQEFFEERHVANIIPQHPRLGTRTMMKREGKVFVEDNVEKLVKKKPMSKVKEN